MIAFGVNFSFYYLLLTKNFYEAFHLEEVGAYLAIIFCAGLAITWQIEPRYMLTGGVIGAFITYTVIKSFDALGPAKSALLIVVAQILVAYLIEVFGWFGVEKAGFEWRKAIGAAVAIAGIVIFRWE